MDPGHISRMIKGNKDEADLGEDTKVNLNDVHISEIRDSFSELVEEVVLGENDRLIVFIDDLDRLEPARAVEALEVLKNILECEKCVFVLAIDYNAVIRGVKEKYGNDFDDEKAEISLIKLFRCHLWFL